MSPLIDPARKLTSPDDPSATDVNGVPFPGMYWALWDADGKLLAYLKTQERVHVDWALHALQCVPTAKYKIGEFTADKWAEFLAAVADGAPTDHRVWGVRS